MGNQPSMNQSMSQSRFGKLNDTKTRKSSISNVANIIPSRDTSKFQSHLKRYKSADGFQDTPNTQGTPVYSVERNRRKLEKHNHAEISEAIDFAKEVSFYLSMVKANTPLNVPSIVVNSDFNNSQVSIKRFSLFKNPDQKHFSQCNTYELNYFFEGLSIQRDQKNVKKIQQKTDIKPIKPLFPRRTINIDLLEGGHQTKTITTPLGFVNENPKYFKNEYTQNILTPKTVISPEGNRKPIDFQIKPNQVFSFHQNLPATSGSSNKKPKQEPQNIIEENSCDDSIELSRSELIDINSELSLQNPKAQNDRISSIGKYLMGNDEPMNDLYKNHQSKNGFLKQKNQPETRNHINDRDDNIHAILKRDSLHRRETGKQFENPRKLDINRFKSSQDIKSQITNGMTNNPKPSVISKTRFDSKPKEIKVDLTALNKNPTKPKIMQTLTQNTSTKKSLRDHMMKARNFNNAEGFEVPEQKPLNVFADEEEKSPADKNKDKYTLNGGASYGRMFEKKKNASISKISKSPVGRDKNDIINEKQTIKVSVDKNKSYSNKQPSKMSVDRHIQPKPAPYNLMSNTMTNKLAVKTVSSPEIELSNNIIQKFRQSAQKKNSTNQFFTAQVPSIKSEPEDSMMLEEESLDNRALYKILNNIDHDSSAKTPQRQSFAANAQPQEDSIYNKFARTTQSSCNSSKQNIKVDINILSKKMKFNFDNQFGNSSQKKFGNK